MSRLRVRIELNRGGVGVPLEKLASVVQQAQYFFRMLGDDVHIDQSQGEWLGFDFDHESLNFTAEFVGPVTAEQVTAFHSAFDGTTGLRRATIAQFARIADAIEEDEVIGFGLYLNEGDDPGEWRCLSRRDALRITEEIRVLLGETETGQESHLPAVADVNTGARYMFGRRDRSVETSNKLAGAVREVEASLSKRISRLEGEVATHSGQILDLRSKSVEAEQSMGRLLSAVEGFCEQAANRLESVTSVPALAAAATAPALVAALPTAAAPLVEAQAPAASPVSVTAHLPAAPPAAVAAATDVSAKSDVVDDVPPLPEKPAPAPKSGDALLGKVAPPDPMPLWGTARVSTATPFTDRTAVWWRSPAVISVAIGSAVILLGMALWPSATPSRTEVTSASEPLHTPATATPAAEIPAAATAADSTPAGSTVSAKPAAPEPKGSPKGAPIAAAPDLVGATRIELEASEPSWISIRGGDGNTQLARLVVPGTVQSVDIREPAVLRTGNAGGLTIRSNGKILGPLGPHGVVREVEFKDGDFKAIPVK